MKTKENLDIKLKVLNQVGTGEAFNYLGQAKYRIGQTVIHVRFCGTDLRGLPHYKFNINPNTLSADYELWICGQADSYYLIPIHIINDINSHQDAYPDNRNPGYTIVSLNIKSHKLTYARGGVSLNIKPYWGV